MFSPLRRSIAPAITVLATFAIAAPLAGASSGPPPGPPLVGQVAGFSPDTANEEAYWYSRYSMMTLTMQSELGTTIPMDAGMMAMMQSMMAAAGAAPGDPIMPPMNPALLRTIYASGDPHYATTPDQSDFATLRWVGGPPRLTTESTAQTVTKELEWAKLFHRAGHFGQPGVDAFGSTQRFVGALLAAMAKMQIQAFDANRSAYESSNAGSYALLTALSDGAGVFAATDEANDQGPAAGAPTYPASNRYRDPAAAAAFRQQADALFPAVLASHPRGPRELSLGIQSLAWYAAIAPDRARHRAAAAVRSWAERLADTEHPARPADLAYQVRGLIEAGRVTGSRDDLARGAEAFRRMVRGFDAVHGVLRGTTTLTTDDVAEITGAFNAAQLFLGGRIDQTRAADLFGAWWEGSVNLSGMEIASPAVDQMKAPFELLDPPGRGATPQPALNYRYPGVPLPQDAGGDHGIAPVLAASVTWDGHAWTADHDRFDVAGAMHAADEMVWLHGDEINGFPQVTLR